MSESRPAGEFYLPEPWEKVLKKRELPNPDLNPLQNQTLGRNLGKWAQVYFTTPPEKRDQAVGELLRELERDANVTKHENPPGQQTSEVSPMDEELVCSACNSPNKSAQRFCGVCGAKLFSPTPQNTPGNSFEKDSSLLRLNQAPEAYAKAYRTIQPAPADTEWIRERTLTRFNVEEPRSGTGWGKYAAIAVLALLAGFGALEWLSRRPVEVQQVVAGSPSAPTSAKAEPQASNAPEATQSQAPVSAGPSTPPETNPQSPARTGEMAKAAPLAVGEEAKSGPREPNQAAEREPLPRVAADSTALPSSDPMSGAQELTLAQHFLGSTGGSRDTAEAAKWLWKSVGKQNTTATVLLADLYAHGDGVAKSCDQARLLLVAAAKKGNAAAGEKLRELETNGCQ
jgi:hypothetical protein